MSEDDLLQQCMFERKNAVGRSCFVAWLPVSKCVVGNILDGYTIVEVYSPKRRRSEQRGRLSGGGES